MFLFRQVYYYTKQLGKSLENKNHNIPLYLFGLILFVNVILRFYNFNSWSFTNDELSAFSRLDFNSFSDLFEKGVKIDGHPALVQVFLFFWTSIFGISEFSTRLPFVLSGIVGCVYFYFFIKDFVNEKAALLSFSAISLSQLFILYSQIARPYSMGFMFVSAFAFYWYRLLTQPRKKAYLIGFVLSGFFGIISHYFASMSISIMLMLGILFFKKHNFKQYFLGGLLICVLFILHINITLFQLKVGGVAWIPAPTENFIYIFWDFLFNNSSYWQYLIYLFPVIAIISRKFNLTQWRIYLLPVLFFAPYYIAYKYSISQSPVMQFSVLIFAAPFFIASFFAFFSEKSNIKLIGVLVVIILTSGSFSLLKERDFYNKRAFADFKGVADHVCEWTEEFGHENIIQFSNSNNPGYLNHYYNQNSTNVDFAIDQYTNGKQLGEARDLIQASNSEFAMVSFANVPAPKEFYELVKEKYPILVKQYKHFNSDVSLFKKGKNKRKTVFNIHAVGQKTWSANVAKDTSNNENSTSSHLISDKTQFAFTYSDTIKNVFKKNKTIVVKGNAKFQKSNKLILVLDISRDGENIMWRGFDIRDYEKKDEWFKFLFTYTKEEQVLDTDQVKIYLWNPEGAVLSVNDITIVNFEDSQYNYYDL